MSAEKRPDGKRKGMPWWAKVALCIVVFLGTAALASFLIMPAWLVQKRMQSGEFTEGDADRMRANLASYINMTGQAMSEAARAGNMDVVLRLSGFMVGTLETVNEVERRNQAITAGWQHSAAAGTIESRDDRLRLIAAVGSSSDVRIEVLCTILGRLSAGENGFIYALEVLALLQEGLSEVEDQQVIDMARRTCKPGMGTALAGALADSSSDGDQILQFSESIVELWGPGGLSSTIQHNTLSPAGAIRLALSSDRSERLRSAAVRDQILQHLVSQTAMGQPLWVEPDESGIPAGILAFNEIVAEADPLFRFRLANYLLAGSSEGIRSHAQLVYDQASAEVHRFVGELAGPIIDQCMSAATEPATIENVTIRLQPTAGTVVEFSGSDVVRECIEGGLGALTFPGHGRLNSEFVIELR